MASVEKRSIALSPELAAAVDQAVAGGEYGNVSEVVRDALRQWKERRELYGFTVDELRQLAQQGIASGTPTDGETAFARIRERLETRIGKREVE
ncbi:putative addiction module antidote protein, CC2985 family [Stappia sp. 22II-S9-Z10]|nr:putative addiction module antidote protein, CC2985 family [Stappia sp. 22II-S9-Z10]